MQHFRLKKVEINLNKKKKTVVDEKNSKKSGDYK